MRLSITLPASLILGMTLGAAVFWIGQPEQPVARTTRQKTALSNAPDASNAAEPNANTETKIERLVRTAKLKGNPNERENQLFLTIANFTAEDFRQLVADAGIVKKLAEDLTKVPQGTRESIFAALVSRCLEVDGGMALASQLIQSIPTKGNARQSIFDSLAKTQPEKSLTLLSLTKDKRQRESFLSNAMMELERRDPAKAAEWLANCADAADRRIAEQAIRLGTVKGDPMRAVEMAAKIEDREQKNDLLQTAADAAAEKGMAEVVRLANSPMEPWMRIVVIGRMVERDPVMALDLATAAGAEESQTTYVVQEAMSAIDGRDHNLAMSKLKGLTGKTLATAIAGISYSWVGRDPAAALEWLAAIPAEDRNDPRRNGGNDTLLTSFTYWAESGQAAARDWADALPDGELKNKVQSTLARVLAKNEPGEATKILASLGEAADQKAFGEVARQWARTDPMAAADWAISQPAGAGQIRALSNIVAEWGNDNPTGVQDWLKQFPAGEARDRSIIAFLQRRDSWASGSEKRAAEFEKWFDVIEDPWSRAQAATSIFWQKRQADPDGARQWLSSLPNVDAEVVRMTLRYNRD